MRQCLPLALLPSGLHLMPSTLGLLPTLVGPLTTAAPLQRAGPTRRERHLVDCSTELIPPPQAAILYHQL